MASPELRHGLCPLSAPTLDATGHAAFTDLFEESMRGDRKELCVSTDGTMVLRYWSVLAPVEPTFVDLGQNLWFRTELRFASPAPVFDGQKLDITALSGTFTAPVLAWQALNALTGSVFLEWAYVEYEGTITFSFAAASL